jgi:hypothetical protein
MRGRGKGREGGGKNKDSKMEAAKDGMEEGGRKGREVR